MKVLVVEPMKECYTKEINGLEEMQALVGGYIQAIYPFPDKAAVVCNEEGKNLGLPFNRPLLDENDLPYDIICGTFFVAGLGVEDFVSLTEEQIRRYKEHYDTAIIRPTPFRIIREIILTDAQYHRFQSDLLAERPYIAARTKLTGYDRETGGFCCLLVTSRNRKDGILVDGEGYHYARYAAYVPNKQALDLRGVVRDNLDLKSKER